MRDHRRRRLGHRAGAGTGALVTSVLLAAAACGGDGGSSDGTVTLRMYSTTTTEPAFSVLIDGFHRSQSKIRVKAEFIPSAKVGQVTTTMMQAGNPPDVIMASPGSGGGSNGMSVYRLAEANRLADLSARPWASDLPALPAVPAGDTATPNLPLEVAGISVAKRGRHVDAAIHFLDYLAAHRDVYSKNSGAFSPAMMAKGELPDFLKPLEPLAKENRFSLAASTMWPSEAPAQVAYKYMTGLHNNTRTVDDILKAMDEAWDNAK